MKKIVLLLSTYLLISAITFSQTLINYPNIDGLAEDSFGFQLLRLALAKTNKNYIVRLAPKAMNQNRAFLEIEKGFLDVVDSGINAEIEERLYPVYLPIDMGLLGWRIFLINKNQEDDFSKIKSLNDLRKKIAGQGIGWTDADIIENVGIRVLKSPKLESLVSMVNKERFDFLPLGANEAHGILRKFGKYYPDLIVEKSIVLVYPFARIYYVKKGNEELHTDIINGLNKAFEDGSYHEFIMNHPFFKEGLEKFKLKYRTIIKVDNPYFSDELNKIDEKWWYKIK